jgi:3-deoxy-D-manno-octulosonate 8-phosphate phosphatase (KDO 8-P phosphatase)
MPHTQKQLNLAKNISLLIMDVDGIFTDGQIFFDPQGNESVKAFHAHDGIGIRRLQQCNIKLAILSGRESPIVIKRMNSLDIMELHLGFLDKLPVFEKILQQHQLLPNQVAYIGDDLPDLPCIQTAGLGVTVPNAIEQVKLHADWITPRTGGMGAVRDLCELIIQAKA